MIIKVNLITGNNNHLSIAFVIFSFYIDNWLVAKPSILASSLLSYWCFIWYQYSLISIFCFKIFMILYFFCHSHLKAPLHQSHHPHHHHHRRLSVQRREEGDLKVPQIKIKMVRWNPINLLPQIKHLTKRRRQRRRLRKVQPNCMSVCLYISQQLPAALQQYLASVITRRLSHTSPQSACFKLPQAFYLSHL